MTLNLLDWMIIASYFLLSLGIGLYYRKRAGKSMSEFFLGGRSLSWPVAGISMVATTFAADTPLAVNEMVATNGISGNWLWWSFLFGGMLTTFFFAKLWRRAGILTEVELIEFRYGGKAAAFLRGFKSIYLGLFMNVLILGWVNVALVSILQIFFGLSSSTALLYVAGAMVVTAGYSAISGLLGVAITDVVQFIIAMAGCIILAILVVQSPDIGGMQGLKAKVPAWAMEFFPSIGSGGGNAVGTLTITLGAFLAYTTVQWWSSWYPGAEPGGGGYVAQRMMSARTERDSLLATLLFQIAHYCLRPWPWIIVGLCCTVLYPELPLDQKRLGYVMAMRDYLPNGLKGLLLVAFLAAYMSTISTQLNWGASYLVNDFLKRFVRKPESFSSEAASERYYVRASRSLTLATMLFSLVVTTQISSISTVWQFIMECGAGLGLVLILRWYWWRINAWAELAATLSPFLWYGLAHLGLGQVFPTSYFFTVGATTLTWLVVMMLTPPESDATLKAFYERVQPMGAWKRVNPGQGPQAAWWRRHLLLWASAVCLTYSVLFATGKWLFAETQPALLYTAAALASALVLGRLLKTEA